MEYIRMKYKGFSFPVNPESVETEFMKKISKREPLFSHTRVEEAGYEPTVLSGSGCFTGEKASENAHALMKLFKEDGSAYLFSPEFCPLKAFFTGLKLSAAASKDCIKYSFTFVEDCAGKKSRFDFGYTYALRGENLYDVANRTGVSVDRLFAANSYEDLFSVSEGDKIWLK